MAQQIGDRAGQQRGDRDLADAEGEFPRPEARQLFEGQFEPDGEQQEDDAQLGQGFEHIGARDEGEAGRADQDAGHEVSQHGAQAEALEQRHADDGRGEQLKHIDQEGGIGHIRCLERVR